MMIKFFRKIRQNLLTDKRLDKYLLYALGEIFLVVVGILIALGINNWNENRKERETEIKILKEIETALNDDLKNISININSYKSGQRAIQIIKEQLALKAPTSDSLSWAFQNSLFNNSVAPNIAGYETLKSKGLDLISNDSLRRSIIDVYEIGYKYYQDNAKNKFLPESFMQEYCAGLFNNLDHFGKEGQPTMVPNDIDQLRTDQTYLTIIHTRMAQVRFALMQLKINKRSVEDLIKNIRKEIIRLM